MYQGELIKLKFEFYEWDIAYVIDRTPKVKIMKKCSYKFTIEIEYMKNE